MPSRKEPFVNGYIYHVFNKCIDRNRPFENYENCQSFYDRLFYYRSIKSTLSFSSLSRLSRNNLDNLYAEISNPKYHRVEVLNYSFMPNHYHLLIRQLTNNGITDFVSYVINSLTRYYNVKNSRVGPLFLKDFKAERIITDEQLIHTSRYIDLNPFSSGLVKLIGDLDKFPWSGFPRYIGKKDDKLVTTSQILGLVGTYLEYEKFVLSRGDYQRSLEFIKHTEKFN